MVTCGIFLPLAVTPCPALRNSSFPIFTDTSPPLRSARRVRNFASDSCDWSMCGILIPASDGVTLASSLLREAIASTIAPSVVSCHEPSRRELNVPRKSALRARMVTTSGAPRCSTSSTVNFPLHTRAKPFQPIYTVRTAPRTGSPTCPSASFSSISSWSASKPRLSVRVMLIRRSLILPVISLLSSISM